MVTLLDSNALIALAIVDHEHHHKMLTWWAKDTPFATCPITQGSLLRYCLRVGVRHEEALAALASITDSRRHEFWPDAIGFEQVGLENITGHRQVTDAYLISLAGHFSGKVLTFDKAMAAAHPRAAKLLL